MDARRRFLDWVEEQVKEGATRTSVAARLGVGPSVISKLDKNGARSVSLALAVAIERVAGIPVEAWVDDDGQEAA